MAATMVGARAAGPWVREARHPGVAITEAAMDEMDEYVMMRVCELIQDGQAIDAAERALASHRGNGGCIALEASWDLLRKRIATVHSTT